MGETEREAVGRGYLASAMRCGFVDIAEGHRLYSARGAVMALGLTDRELGFFDATMADFFLEDTTVRPGRVRLCYGESDVMDFLDALEERDRRKASGLIDLDMSGAP
ncbi:MAG: hypothetical protein FWD94_02835 [Treponema sp.]|nr:hypothetical protein [Treponema sp.]